MSRILTNCKGVHVLMTSLSSQDLQDACTPSGRPVKFVSRFDKLNPDSIAKLEEDESERVQEKLRSQQFQDVIRECLGLPRLLECVFKVARFEELEDGTTTNEVRRAVERPFNPQGKYENEQWRCAAVFAAFSTYQHHTEHRRALIKKAEDKGYLFFRGSSNSSEHVLIPPVILRWWRQDFPRVDDDTDALLRAASQFVSLSNTGQRDGKPWEKQLVHLWRILTITDRMWRAEQKGQLPRTILGQLGLKSKLCNIVRTSVYPGAFSDNTAVFNYRLKEVDSYKLMKDFKMVKRVGGHVADVPGDMKAGETYFPLDDNNTGFDFAVADKIVGRRAKGLLITFVEAKFSSPNSSAKLRAEDIVNKFLLALEGRPIVKRAFAERRLCYVIGVGQPQPGLMENMSAVFNTIAGRIRPFNGLPIAFGAKRALVRGSLLDFDEFQTLLRKVLDHRA